MYASRRPAVILPNNTMFVPNYQDLGALVTANIATNTRGADSAGFIPFSPPYDTAVKSISAWCVSGTTENFDIGLYDEAFTRLGSLGSTGIASTTGIKTWTPSTPIPVYANTTYIAAFVCSSATPTWVMQGASNVLRGISVQSSAMPLPDPASPTPGTQQGAQPILKIVFSG